MISILFRSRTRHIFIGLCFSFICCRSSLWLGHLHHFSWWWMVKFACCTKLARCSFQIIWTDLNTLHDKKLDVNSFTHHLILNMKSPVSWISDKNLRLAKLMLLKLKLMATRIMHKSCFLRHIVRTNYSSIWQSASTKNDLKIFHHTQYVKIQVTMHFFGNIKSIYKWKWNANNSRFCNVHAYENEQTYLSSW